LRFRLWLAQLFAPEPSGSSGSLEQSVDVGSLKEAIGSGSPADLDPEQIEVLERGRVALEERLRVEAERNLRESLVLRSLEFSSVDFFVDTTWEVRPNVNVLLGRNGFGKSFLLRALAGMLQRDERVTDVLFQDSGPRDRLELRLTRNGREERIVRSPPNWRGDTVGKVPLLAIPDSRFTDRRMAIVPEPETLDLASKGALHVIEQLPYQTVVGSLLWGLCIDYWEHGETFELPTFELLRKVIRELTDETFDFDSIKRVGRTAFEMYVRTEGLGRPLLIQQASQGTLSVLTMFGLIQAYLLAIAAAANPSHEPAEAQEQQAIVLVDEVDAHLHPVWQQKIRNLLTETFPNVQFILTAHSPLVVAGCGPYEVSVLRRAGGRFRIDQLPEDFVGKSSQEIYREDFDVEDVDDVFLRYSTDEARGRLGEIQKRIEKLSRREEEELSQSEAEELQALFVHRERLARVAEIEQQRRTQEQREVTLQSRVALLEAERSRLQQRVADLESEPRPGSWSEEEHHGGEVTR
jgi:energy-coupling factor transporter ATP-binding protein EcfA2